MPSRLGKEQRHRSIGFDGPAGTAKMDIAMILIAAKVTISIYTTSTTRLITKVVFQTHFVISIVYANKELVLLDASQTLTARHPLYAGTNDV